MHITGLAYLAAIKRRCEEELVLADGSHFFEVVFTGKLFFRAGQKHVYLYVWCA